MKTGRKLLKGGTYGQRIAALGEAISEETWVDEHGCFCGRGLCRDWRGTYYYYFEACGQGSQGEPEAADWSDWMLTVRGPLGLPDALEEFFSMPDKTKLGMRLYSDAYSSSNPDERD